MNENFTIPAFAEPITSLPDTPACTATELKRRFQAPAEELREAHNALAQCVAGITSATYPDTVTEDMLTDELSQKINGKAEQTDMDAVQKAVAQKCEAYIGTYTGDGKDSKKIDLGFPPKAVLVVDHTGTMHYEHNLGNHTFSGGLATPGEPLAINDHTILSIYETGFMVYSSTYTVGSSSHYMVATNQGLHHYIAFR